MYVFDDKLWVVGGNAWPLQNDVWNLSIDGLSFISQPKIEQYVGTLYRYDARADFHRSPGPLTYRLVQAPEWLRIDPANGRITGTPSTPGTFEVLIEAATTRERAQQHFALEVLP